MEVKQGRSPSSLEHTYVAYVGPVGPALIEQACRHSTALRTSSCGCPDRKRGKRRLANRPVFTDVVASSLAGWLTPSCT